MFRTKTSKLFGIVAAALMLMGTVKAAAVTYDLTSDHCTGGCGTAPFGTVTLTESGLNLDIVVHLLNGNLFVLTGAADFQDFKFNAVGVSLADITVDAHTPPLIATTGAFNGDGTGNFSFGITCPTCPSGGGSGFAPDISFHIANASIADLTVPNNLGNVFVADILSAATGNTGPVDATIPSVPEPITSALVGTGLLSLAFFRLRRAKK